MPQLPKKLSQQFHKHHHEQMPILLIPTIDLNKYNQEQLNQTYFIIFSFLPEKPRPKPLLINPTKYIMLLNFYYLISLSILLAIRRFYFLMIYLFQNHLF